MLRIFRGERSAAPAAEQAEEPSEQPEQQVAARADQAAQPDQHAESAVSSAEPPKSPPEHPPGPSGEQTLTSTPSAIAGSAAEASPGFLARGRMRRRMRFLRAARELAYRDLGGLVFELHRFGQSNDEVVHAKLATLGRIDTELRALQDALRAPQPLTVLRKAGVAACPRCAAIHGSADRYCPTCGLAARQDERPIAGTHAPAAGATAMGRPTGLPAPQPPQPAAQRPPEQPPGQPSAQPSPMASPPPQTPPGADSTDADRWDGSPENRTAGDRDQPTRVVQPVRPAEESQRRAQGAETDQSTQAFETIPPAGGMQGAHRERERS